MQHFVKSDFRRTALPAVPYLAGRVAAAQDDYIIASQSDARLRKVPAKVSVNQVHRGCVICRPVSSCKASSTSKASCLATDSSPSGEGYLPPPSSACLAAADSDRPTAGSPSPPSQARHAAPIRLKSPSSPRHCLRPLQ
uniref:Uncharacterized protein n=1 Tax=Branchiostoma floridae TaxID=7739 RepID=C3ZRA2_BRAFL|eukprot:XP_002588964.1 hypothetical protein BRAFLDRAFT_89155 [Branchiostoma floridae]